MDAMNNITFTQTASFLLQNETTWSEIYHHIRQKTGHMGLHQNRTRQDSSEFYFCIW